MDYMDTRDDLVVQVLGSGRGGRSQEDTGHQAKVSLRFTVYVWWASGWVRSVAKWCKMDGNKATAVKKVQAEMSLPS